MRDHIHRGPLLSRLDAALNCRLTVIHAPAGYGKTSLLSQWIDQASGSARIALISLKRDDTDMRSLTRAILQAVGKAADESERGKGQTRVPTELAPGTAISLLISRLEREAGAFVVILDDYHLIERPEIDALVRQLISQAPVNCHFVISSRDNPWLGQSILAAEEQLLELTAEDLRFSLDEARLLLEKTIGGTATPTLASGNLRSIVERTEGWPIALKLAWLSLKRGTDFDDLLDEFRSPGPELARYLSQQVLATMPEDTQDLIMRTSILDRLTGDLVNLLCDRHDGWLMLERLEEQGAFLTPLDPVRRTYRYHQLFGEHMRERLERCNSPLYRALHRRAAEWFAARGDIAEAVSHAAQSDDDELLVVILEDAGGWRLIPDGEQPAVERGLVKLPAATIDARPRLVLTRVYLEIKRGELATARADFDQLLAKLGGQEVSADVWTDVRMMEDVLADYENEPCSLDDLLAREALLRTLPTNDHFVLADFGGTLAAHYYEGGWLERAMEPALTAGEHHRASGALYSGMYTRFWESRIRRAQGRFNDAAAILADARGDIDANFGPRSDLAANCAAYAAELLYERDERAAASRLLQWAVPHMEQSDGWVDVYGAAYFTAARIAASEGFPGDALAMVERARVLAGKRRLRQLALLSDLCELDIRIDHDPTLDAARALAVRIDLDALATDPGDHARCYRWVVTAAALCSGKLNLLDREFEAAARGLRGLKDWATRHGAARTLVDINLLLAYGLHATGAKREAQDRFNDAVGIAMFQGIARPFIDKARFTATLLGDALGGAVRPDRFRQDFLKTVARGLSAQRADGTSPRLLSEAQKQVLKYVSQGHSNVEIAALIGMSHDTVKYRLKTTFKRLRVETREEAVRVAQQRGLITGEAAPVIKH